MMAPDLTTDELAALIHEYGVGTRGMVLTGSYARGDATPYSDVDLLRFVATLPASEADRYRLAVRDDVADHRDLRQRAVRGGNTMNALQQPTTGHADVNDVWLSYEVAGAGHPLVLLHFSIASPVLLVGNSISRNWSERA